MEVIRQTGEGLPNTSTVNFSTGVADGQDIRGLPATVENHGGTMAKGRQSGHRDYPRNRGVVAEDIQGALDRDGSVQGH